MYAIVYFEGGKSALGVSEEAGRPLLDTLADALRPRRMVLALDNCEHLIDACAHLGRRLLTSSPGLRATTAARHVANILAKLGFRSRTQIAAWVADRPSRADGPT
jgi:predicted ATPase